MTEGYLVHAGRTVTAMSAATDRRMVEEFMAGADVPTIAARYAVPEEYVDRVIEQTHLDKPAKRWSWSWTNWGNRLVYCLLAGAVINWTTGIYALGTVIAVVLFVLTSAIVAARRD
jgi:hypothetical protein